MKLRTIWNLITYFFLVTNQIRINCRQYWRLISQNMFHHYSSNFGKFLQQIKKIYNIIKFVIFLSAYMSFRSNVHFTKWHTQSVIHCGNINLLFISLIVIKRLNHTNIRLEAYLLDTAWQKTQTRNIIRSTADLVLVECYVHWGGLVWENKLQ